MPTLRDVNFDVIERTGSNLWHLSNRTLPNVRNCETLQNKLNTKTKSKANWIKCISKLNINRMYQSLKVDTEWNIQKFKYWYTLFTKRVSLCVSQGTYKEAMEQSLENEKCRTNHIESKFIIWSNLIEINGFIQKLTFVAQLLTIQ